MKRIVSIGLLIVGSVVAEADIIQLDAYYGSGYVYPLGSITPSATISGLFLSTPISPQLASQMIATGFSPIINSANITNWTTLTNLQFLTVPPQNLNASQNLFDAINLPCTGCQTFDTGPVSIGTIDYPLTAQDGNGATIRGVAEVSYFTRIITEIEPTPEPSTLWVLILAIMLFVVYQRKYS